VWDGDDERSADQPNWYASGQPLSDASRVREAMSYGGRSPRAGATPVWVGFSSCERRRRSTRELWGRRKRSAQWQLKCVGRAWRLLGDIGSAKEVLEVQEATGNLEWDGDAWGLLLAWNFECISTTGMEVLAGVYMHQTGRPLQRQRREALLHRIRVRASNSRDVARRGQGQNPRPWRRRPAPSGISDMGPMRYT